MNGHAVDHQPGREQRNVCFRNMNHDPGDQERDNHNNRDRERIPPPPRQGKGEGQRRRDNGEREPVTECVVCHWNPAVGDREGDKGRGGEDER